MGWGRMDDTFDDHPKVLALLDDDDPVMAGLAIGVWTLCFTWAHRNTRKKGKIPGRVPAGLPRRFFGPAGKQGAALLVKHGLWETADEGGWQFHDFDKYLPTEETREARSEAGKRGAEKRWANRGASGHEATERQGGGKLPSGDSKLPSGHGNQTDGSQDSDDNSVANDGSRAGARRAISKEIAPDPDPEPGTSSRRTSGPKRATRIPADFHVTPEMVAWAKERVPNVDGRLETEKFINHWRAKSGKDATKLDWPATWRNWMLNANDRYPSNRAGYRTAGAGSDDRKSTTDQRVAQGLELAARLDAQYAQQALGGTP